MLSLKQITWLNNKLKGKPIKTQIEDGVNSGCTLKG